MNLIPGTRLGPYEVVAPLGAGGMGEVFRARDTKLGREVALKILPADLATDPDRLARFEREARTLAALNHPHIAQVYGFEEGARAPGTPAVQALVMELVPGESLATRLASAVARGLPLDQAQGGQPPGLPLREALELARQIADGFEAAHEKGIVHRDLKPANVQVTPDGQAKILDFGLAKATAPEDADDVTLTSPAQMTRAGIVLGTAAYMSPEQARGLPVDPRTDVWAFGALLYEMLTGTRPFPGPTMTDTLAQILERDPEWSKLPAATPGPVRALIQRCLRKEPKQRLHNIADARFTLEDALAALSSGAQDAAAATGARAAIATRPARPIWRHPLPLGLALASLAISAGLVWSLTRTPAPAPREPLFLSLMLPPDQEMVQGALQLSPDGKSLVYSAIAEEGPPGPEGNVVRLYHRRLADPVSRVLPGTEYAWGSVFSPEGASLAFFARPDQKLKKIALSGGGAAVVADAPWFGWAPTMSWSETGHVLLADNFGPVWRVHAAGGEAEVVVPRSAFRPGESGTSFPHMLPGSTGILFSVLSDKGPSLAVWAGGQRRDLPIQGLEQARLAGSFLLGWRSASATQVDLVAVPFDRARGEATGEAVPVLSEGARASPVTWASTGTLAYRATTGGRQPPRFTWLALDGSDRRPVAMQFRQLPMGPRVSPDGRRVAWPDPDPSGARLLVGDIDSGLTRVVATKTGMAFAWTPDGRRLVHQIPLDAPGGTGLQWRPVDGSGAPERLTTGKVWQQPQFVTRDGRFLVYQEAGGVGTRASETEDNYDLWLLPLVPRGEPRPLLKTPANDRLAHVSPDGRWMAYVSDEGGRDEIWVRAFPEGDAAVQVSRDGGTEPLWAPDGATLYYRDRTGARVHAVPVTPGPVPQFGAPVVTAGHWHPGLAFLRNYDITPDGGALLLLQGISFGREIRVILNFDVLVQRKMAEAGR